MQITGWPSRPRPNVSSAYGGVGRVMASAASSPAGCVFGSTPSRSLRRRSNWKANSSYSSQVTSWTPIQNGATVTSCWGPSCGRRSASSSGLPIVKVPPGIGTISKAISVPGIVSV